LLNTAIAPYNTVLSAASNSRRTNVSKQVRRVVRQVRYRHQAYSLTAALAANQGSSWARYNLPKESSLTVMSCRRGSEGEHGLRRR
jgi:hypothetical protein